jgi:hypothetical protein
MFPEKRPDYIYIKEEKINDSEAYNMFCTAFDYDYVVTEIDCGIIIEPEWN